MRIEVSLSINDGRSIDFDIDDEITPSELIEILGSQNLLSKEEKDYQVRILTNKIVANNYTPFNEYSIQQGDFLHLEEIN